MRPVRSGSAADIGWRPITGPRPARTRPASAAPSSGCLEGETERREQHPQQDQALCEIDRQRGALCCDEWAQQLRAERARRQWQDQPEMPQCGRQPCIFVGRKDRLRSSSNRVASEAPSAPPRRSRNRLGPPFSRRTAVPPDPVQSRRRATTRPEAIIDCRMALKFMQRMPRIAIPRSISSVTRRGAPSISIVCPVAAAFMPAPPECHRGSNASVGCKSTVN